MRLRGSLQPPRRADAVHDRRALRPSRRATWPSVFDVDVLDVAAAGRRGRHGAGRRATRSTGRSCSAPTPGARSGCDWATSSAWCRTPSRPAGPSALATPPAADHQRRTAAALRPGSPARHLLDVGTARPAARWLLVAMHASQTSRMLEGKPVPLGPSRWIRLPSDVTTLADRPDPASNRSVIDSAPLLKDLKAQLKLLQADLRARAEDAADEWGARLRRSTPRPARASAPATPWIDVARQRGRPGRGRLDHRDDVHALLRGQRPARRRPDDGRPVPVGWIAGPGERTARAEENLTAYFRANPTHNRRRLAAAGVPRARRPAGRAGAGRPAAQSRSGRRRLSAESATALIDFWRRTDACRCAGPRLHRPRPRHPVPRRPLPGPLRAREEDLRAAADPGLRRGVHPRPDPDARRSPSSGSTGLKLIDPTCGSGHFLLGAFDRLVDAWAAEAPALDVKRAGPPGAWTRSTAWTSTRSRSRSPASGSPSPASRRWGSARSSGCRAFGFHLAIGDSLLGELGGVRAQLPFEASRTTRTYFYDTEDLKEYAGILSLASTTSSSATRRTSRSRTRR